MAGDSVKYDPILGCVGWEFKKPFTREVFKKEKTSNKYKNKRNEKNRR
tara:strand:- start:201 stop:344 length:144 start_codon:yes stop_codon:yes gene_type:complete